MNKKDYKSLNDVYELLNDAYLNNEKYTKDDLIRKIATSKIRIKVLLEGYRLINYTTINVITGVKEK